MPFFFHCAGPTNEMANPADLFDFDIWSQNPLGLIIVLTLLALVHFIVCSSLRTYKQSFKAAGQDIDIETERQSMFAQKLKIARHGRATATQKLTFKLRCAFAED